MSNPNIWRKNVVRSYHSCAGNLSVASSTLRIKSRFPNWLLPVFSSVTLLQSHWVPFCYPKYAKLIIELVCKAHISSFNCQVK